MSIFVLEDLVAEHIGIVANRHPKIEKNSKPFLGNATYWFKEIEACFAYVLTYGLDQVILDESTYQKNSKIFEKYKTHIQQLYPKTVIKTFDLKPKTCADNQDLIVIPTLNTLFKQGEIKSLFQPIVDISTQANKIYGFECLSRLHYANRPFAPDFLFNYAQEKILVVNYDKICLMQALSLCPKETLIFVNVRPQTLMIPNFCPWFKNVLKKNQIAFEQVIVEVTEQYSVISEREILKNCLLLKKLGIRIAIDDFGCGISNHKMLEILHPDFIKISGRFISESNFNITKQIIIKNIMNLCQDLGIKAIVENVETQKENQIVKKLGARIAQGFYFFKPLENDRLKEILNCDKKSRQKIKSFV